MNKNRIAPNADGFQEIDVPAGETTVSIHLSTAPRVVARANDTAAMYYGSLFYTLAIEPEISSSPPIAYRNQQPLPANTTDPEGRTKDFRLTSKNGTKWNIAIDPTQVQVMSNNISTRLPSPILDLGAPPVELRVAAVEIDWPIAFDSPADPGMFHVTAKG